jgi:hypothetical protein
MTGTTKPTIGGCTSIFQFNDASGELTLINPLDYESKDKTFFCYFLLNNVDLRTLTINVLDDNDNVPYITNVPSEALSWEEVTFI